MRSYLALGDSYTIGEGTSLSDSYPYQTVQLLRKTGRPFFAPEIIARTGWTTDELMDAIARTRLLPAYELVTLLIGVNNQYRGRELAEYGDQLEQLLRTALALADHPRGQVIVLSIPDWGVTPFAVAAGKDPQVIAADIDAFNQMAREITARQGLPFIDITPHSRTQGGYPDNFTADGLHPGAGQYAHWASQLVEVIQ